MLARSLRPCTLAFPAVGSIIDREDRFREVLDTRDVATELKVGLNLGFFLPLFVCSILAWDTSIVWWYIDSSPHHDMRVRLSASMIHALRHARAQEENIGQSDTASTETAVVEIIYGDEPGMRYLTIAYNSTTKQRLRPLHPDELFSRKPTE